MRWVRSPGRSRAGRVVVIPTLALVLLTACGAGDTGALGPGAKVHAPVPTTTTTGETISAHDAERLPSGQRAYVLPDETRVVVSSSEPLPERVRAAVQAQVDRTIQDPGVPGRITTNRSLIVDTAEGIAHQAALRTGKRIVFVYPLVGSCSPETAPYLGWTHTSITYYDAFDCDVLPTREEAEQRVAATIAAQPEPERYQVFVRE